MAENTAPIGIKQERDWALKTATDDELLDELRKRRRLAEYRVSLAATQHEIYALPPDLVEKVYFDRILDAMHLAVKECSTMTSFEDTLSSGEKARVFQCDMVFVRPTEAERKDDGKDLQD